MENNVLGLLGSLGAAGIRGAGRVRRQRASNGELRVAPVDDSASPGSRVRTAEDFTGCLHASVEHWRQCACGLRYGVFCTQCKADSEEHISDLFASCVV